MMIEYNKVAGGLYGLLVGDALGVPYEFYEAQNLPSYECIEMTPPPGFKKTYAGVEAGTWSDDGAQALCLFDSLLKQGRFSLEDFSHALSSWYEKGFWAVDGVVFDVGVQTANALTAYKNGLSPEKCGLINPEGKGNGALMRTLPLVLWHWAIRQREYGQGSKWKKDRQKWDEQLVEDAHKQCMITHGHLCNQVCCALYCLVAQALLEGMGAHTAIENGVARLREVYRNRPEYEQELEWSVRPELPWEGTGTGYVVECLRSAFMVLEQSGSYEETVKRAVLLGNDTDTTACVAGGLAGILYGEEGIPDRWKTMLREKDKVRGLLERWQKIRKN